MAALLAFGFFGTYGGDGALEGYSLYGYGREMTYDNWPSCMYHDTARNAARDMPCTEVANDGECDRSCNTEECGWDGDDCFHGDSGCYTEPDGNDYRGNVSTNQAKGDNCGSNGDDGCPCVYWSDHMVAAAYVKSFGKPALGAYNFLPENYPDAGLGGHNYCRNPDHGIGKCKDGADCHKPWCFHWVKPGQLGWDYCDVPEPSKHCQGKREFTHPVSELALKHMVVGRVTEHQYDYYKMPVRATLTGLHVVLVPTGPPGPEPRLFADFDVPYPTGHNASYMIKPREGVVSELRMTRKMYGFCGGAMEDMANCTLHLSVMGQETANYSLIVHDMVHPDENICAAHCDWSSIGDGDCDPQCNNEPCFFDRGDCEANEAAGCSASCNRDYIGDGGCDVECFTWKCSWDGGDCGNLDGDGNPIAGCADKCLTIGPLRMIDNDRCDAECNVASCNYDGGDCFHDHHECFTWANGYDYRGTVSHTRSGKQCQRWSETTPNMHNMSDRTYPAAGLGGHNFCRNPDKSESVPWCYLDDPQRGDDGKILDGQRFERCDVGDAAESCVQYTPSPPSAPPPLPPPPQCPTLCAELANNGECDSACNSTACLWDKGDCGDLLAHMLLTLSSKVGLRTSPDASRLKILLSGDLRDAALQLGLALGVLGACAAVCIALCLKRQQRLRQLRQRSGSNKYTAYGESAGSASGDTEITVARHENDEILE